MSKVILQTIAKAAFKTAKLSGNSASFFAAYQPKEPKTLQKKTAARK